MGFNWLDYTILLGYFGVILLIGSAFARSQGTLTDFFLGSRRMPWLAVGCSILATYLSAISLVGIPAEFWEHGFQTCWLTLCIPLTAPIVIALFVRLYTRLEVTTAYEYLEQRFSPAVRAIGSSTFMLFRGAYLGVALYASSAFLEPAFGPHVEKSWLIVGMGICAAVLAVTGGIKAVIWTDVLQLTIIYGGMAWLCLTAVGRVDGGLTAVWDVCAADGKDFSFFGSPDYWSLSPFIPATVWGILLGESFFEIAAQGTDQMAVQRYLTTTSTRDAARSIWAYAVLALPVVAFLWFAAAALFAFFKTNPEQLPASVEPNELLPYFVVSQLPHGVAGAMVAAIVSAVVTTVNSGVNCLAAVTVNDFLLRFGAGKRTDRQLVRLARVWTILWSVAAIGLGLLILVIARENIFRTALAVMGLFSGVLLGVFLLGILTRRANTGGVLIGAVCGMAVVTWASFGWTSVGPDSVERHISFLWPSVISTVGTVSIGFAASFAFPSPTEVQLRGLTVWNGTNGDGPNGSKA